MDGWRKGERERKIVSSAKVFSESGEGNSIRIGGGGLWACVLYQPGRQIDFPKLFFQISIFLFILFFTDKVFFPTTNECIFPCNVSAVLYAQFFLQISKEEYDSKWRGEKKPSFNLADLFKKRPQEFPTHSHSHHHPHSHHNHHRYSIQNSSSDPLCFALLLSTLTQMMMMMKRRTHFEFVAKKAFVSLRNEFSN